MTEAVKKPLPETVEKLLTETTNDKELVKQLDKTLGNWGYLMEKVFKKCINRIIDKNSNTLKTGGKKGKKGKKSDSKKGGLDRNIVFAVVINYYVYKTYYKCSTKGAKSRDGNRRFHGGVQ